MYLGSNTRIIFMNPLVSSTENGIMSFAMNVPIDRLISVCQLDVLDSLCLIANASCYRNCPLPLLFFTTGSSIPTLTAMLLAEMTVHRRCRTRSILKFTLANFTHSNCYVFLYLVYKNWSTPKLVISSPCYMVTLLTIIRRRSLVKLSLKIKKERIIARLANKLWYCKT